MRHGATIPAFSGDDARRLDVIAAGRSGLDYVDARPDGRTLIVAFFGPLPEKLGHQHFVIEGGPPQAAIRVTSMRLASNERDAEGVVTLRLDRTGNESTYTLRVVGVADVDRLYAALPFTFDRSTERLTDCTDEPAAALPVPAAPHIDYTAKDYATFRRLLLDRASLVMPDWNEQHVPDLGVTLIELFAYVGDQLSYYQDAVATEAYLSTARKRVSIKRHARLLDYRMHDGCNARAWISLRTATDVGPIDPREIAFATDRIGSEPAQYFEPLGHDALHVYAAHAPMRLYAWGSKTCALSAGATAATLRDGFEPPDAEGAEPLRSLRRLEAGQCLLFEQVRAVENGVEVASDPLRRHVVRLTHVRRDVDALYDQPIVEIAWAYADRLPFDLPIVAPSPDPGPGIAPGPPLELCVAWGNLVAVDNGRSMTLAETIAPASSGTIVSYGPLAQPNLTFAEAHRAGPAAALDERDARAAQPQIFEVVTLDADGRPRRWYPSLDLLSSDAVAARYVVEVDENGFAMLRFGDGVLGRRPPAGATARARYRVGNGSAGNVGAESIVNVVVSGKATGIALSARNPLSARGGTDSESVDDVRAFAPSAWRAETGRAIAPEDYARIAQSDPRVQNAAAEFRWTGSRTIVRVALDPLGTDDVEPGLLADVAAFLEPMRRIGHDVDVVAATYVPLVLALDIQVKHGYQRGHILAALEKAFGNETSSDGTRGFFQPDALTFGSAIAQSAIVACALAVTGVEDVSVRRLERLYDPGKGPVPVVLRFGALEVPQLDGDPAHPERGVLELTLRGGR